MAPPLRLPLSNGFLCRLFGQCQYFRNRSAFFQRLFLRLFSTAFSSDVAIWWIAFLDFFLHAGGPRTVRLAHTVQLFLYLKTSWMSFFSRGLVYFFGHQKTFFSMTNQKLFCFSCAWRRLVMSEEDSWCLKKRGEAFHTRRQGPWRRHQESCLVAHKTPIWLAHTHFAWQTKLWLSEDVSVRFNQNLLKQCTHKYYIRLSG